MPDLSWEKFESLQGDATTNFEVLCRELVRRNYSRFGEFRSVLQQPGVEFHLCLTENCELASNGRHFGWQCRFYSNVSGALGTTRKKKIKESIEKSEQVIPGLTNWVLWTKRQLTPDDQKWFYGLKTTLKLHCWAEEELNGLMQGSASVLRESFFGELILLQEDFEQMHEFAIAPIRKRWDPKVHVEVDVETAIRSNLGSAGTWNELSNHGTAMAERAKEFAGLEFEKTQKEFELIRDSLARQAVHLKDVGECIDGKPSFNQLKAAASSRELPSIKKSELHRLGSKLRAWKNENSIPVSSANFEITRYFELLDQLETSLDQNILAVVGSAGDGKTCLAAKLTNWQDDSPGGILLLARFLQNNQTLDNLVSRSLGHAKVKTFEQLLEASDAAGKRLGVRLPIVIDGLNESENPRNWKSLIQQHESKIKSYENIAVLLTLRQGVDSCLGEELRRYHLQGFQYNLDEAIEKYFTYFEISQKGVHQIRSLFSSPLFLSLFCQAVNPDRKEFVEADKVPTSATEVFIQYKAQIVERIAEQLDLNETYVETSLKKIALQLWRQDKRELDFDAVKTLIDKSDSWQKSLTRKLEEEGVLGRKPEWQGPGQSSSILYDAFAGFLIADALVTDVGNSEMDNWIAENSERLTPTENRHPLKEDIVAGFVGLFPRKVHRQFWESVTGDLRDEALLESANLASSRLDERTLGELSKLVGQISHQPFKSVFSRLYTVHDSASHRLNAEFTSSSLFKQSVGERDLQWSEWLRSNRAALIYNLEYMEKDWKQKNQLDEADVLSAKLVCWMLTSNVRHLRDQATKTLQVFGQVSPRALFELASEFAKSNDPYVVERIFAACFGVVMAFQGPKLEELKEAYQYLIERINCLFLKTDCETPTNHYLLRKYLRGIVEFGALHFPLLLPSALAERGKISFQSGDYTEAENVHNEFTGQIGMDFENYTVGGIFEGRRNYDYSHEGYSKAIAEIKGRVWELGWRHKDFHSVDEQIGRGEYGYARREEKGKIERYAKKYGWIAFYETAGFWDCLLYTSPSPRDATLSRMPSSA